MAKTTVKFSVTNFSKTRLGLLQKDGKPALLDLYGNFHTVPTTIEPEKSYSFDLAASAHAVGGFVYYNHAQPSELLVVMVCAAKQDGINNVVRSVCTLNNVTADSTISAGENEPACAITLKSK